MSANSTTAPARKADPNKGKTIVVGQKSEKLKKEAEAAAAKAKELQAKAREEAKAAAAKARKAEQEKARKAKEAERAKAKKAKEAERAKKAKEAEKAKAAKALAKKEPVDVATIPHYKEWVDKVVGLVQTGDQLAWRIADELVAAEKEVGAGMDQLIYDVARETGRDEHTIQNWFFLGKRFGKDDRTVAASVGHYDAVAGLPEARDRRNVLIVATRNKWSVQETRRAVRALKSGTYKDVKSLPSSFPRDNEAGRPERYQCPVCGDWHVTKTWSDKDAEDAREAYNPAPSVPSDSKRGAIDAESRDLTDDEA